MLIKEGMLISKYGKTPVNWLLDKFLQEYVIDENVISRVLVLFKSYMLVVSENHKLISGTEKHRPLILIETN
jgi:hypothetical protein